MEFQELLLHFLLSLVICPKYVYIVITEIDNILWSITWELMFLSS